MADRMKRLWQGGKWLALLALGILIGASLIEGALRIAPEAFPKRIQNIVKGGRLRVKLDSTKMPDAYLGEKLRPGLDVEIVEHQDYQYRIKTYLNYPDVGFRGNVRERPTIGLALGDSFTFGVGVDPSETWPEVLSKVADGNFVNLGVPGYGPPQYTRVLRKYGVALHPRIVVYAFSQNDVADSECFARWLTVGGEYSCPTRRGHASALEKFAARHLYTYWVARGFGEAAREPRRLAVYDSPDMGVHLIFDLDTMDRRTARGRRPESLSAATTDAILEASRIAAAAGATFILLLIPSKEQAHQHIISQYMSAPSIDDVDAVNVALIEFCRQHKIRWIDLTPSFRAGAKQDKQLYYRADGHWNAEGHRVAAQRIFDYLKKEKLL